MKYLKRKDGMVLPLAIVLIAVVIIVVGLAIYTATKSSQKDVHTVSASSSPSESPVTKVSPTPTPSQSDNDLIAQAVRTYTPQSANDTVAGITIVGSNAKGNGTTPGAASSYEFISHKDNGTWKIVYRGQEQPGKALGAQYSLPTDWYSMAY
jgi:cell division septation protein DedD